MFPKYDRETHVSNRQQVNELMENYIHTYLLTCLSVKFHTKALIATALTSQSRIRSSPVGTPGTPVGTPGTPVAVFLVRLYLYPCCALTYTRSTGVER